MTRSVLIVDDQATERRLLYHVLKKDYQVHEAANRTEALDSLETKRPDLVILDMHLPPKTASPEEGVRLRREIGDRYPGLPIVIATGDQDRALALDMVQNGVADFLQKPVDAAVLRIVVARALARGQLERELERLRSELHEKFSFGQLIGRSARMQQVFATLERLAGSNTSILLLGESGTGKSAIARAIHRASARSEKPFVVVDPAAMPESLMESELFGHVKGAFTGAESDKTGRFQAANHGTLFLDEIGNLNASVQAKLLLFLDNHTVRRVGSADEQPVDVRILAATNHDLEGMVREGQFRQDLLFRIQVATVTLPPLRERPEDIEALSDLFLSSLCKGMRRPPVRLTDAAREQLREFAWPGNVRQLRHVLETSLVLADGATLDVTDCALPSSQPPAGPTAAQTASDSGDLKTRVAAFERGLLQEALAETDGNKAAAGRRLGLDENQVHYLCRKHGLR